MAEPQETRRCVVVGILPEQPDAVIIQVAELAEDLDAELVFASVDLSRYAVEEHPDGVAIHLTHRQHRPVIVIPTSPVLNTAALPWVKPR